MDQHFRRSLAILAVLAGTGLASCSGASDAADRSPADPLTAEAEAVRPLATPPAGDAEPATTTDSVVRTGDPRGEAMGDSARTTSLPSVQSDAAPSVPPEDVEVGDMQGKTLIDPALEVAARILDDPREVDQDSLVTVAQGVALEGMEASAAEFAINGWAQSGSPDVVRAEVTAVDAEAEPPVVTVAACLDHSGVDIIDSTGASIVDPDARTQALNIFVLRFVEDRWVLVERSFPDDPSC